MNSDFTIVGDGKMVAIICGDMAYVLNEPYLKDVQLTHNDGGIHAYIFGGVAERISGPRSVEVSLTLMSNGEVDVVSASEIKLNNVDSMSIMELLAHINKKLEQRYECKQ